MKTTFRILALLILSSLFACVLYPLVYHFWAGILGQMDEPPRIFRRVWMLAIFLGLLLNRHSLGLRSPSKVGFQWSKEGASNFAIGFTVACVFLAAVSLLYWLTGAWVRRPLDASYIWERFYQGFLQGVLVAMVEEYVFRGLIFFTLARRWGWVQAAVFTSLIFASLHFFEGRGLEHIENPASWDAGFRIAGMLLGNMANEFTLFPDAVGLFMVGMILCDAAYRTGTLWYPAGLHGGWVFYAKFKAAFFDPHSANEFLIGGGRMFNGVYPMLFMLIIFPITHLLLQYGWLYMRKNKNPIG